MKNCKPFEKQLVAYLHGELNETDAAALDRHLESCAACRAELAAQRATLDLLGEALAAAPAPVQLVAKRDIPHRPAAHRTTLADYWYSPQFRAGLVTAATASIFIFISLSFVVVQVVKKESPAFAADEVAIEAPAPQEPHMELQKLKVPQLEKSVAQSAPKPKLKKQVVAKSSPTFKAVPVPEAAPIISAEALGDEGLVASLGFSTQPWGQDKGVGEPLVRRGVWQATPAEFNTEQYDRIVDNAFKDAMDNPLSTFSIDVDRAAYANVRRYLTGNRLPPPDAVRIEEMVNYFEYDYPQPSGEDPFAVSMEVADCPWNQAHRLALIGLQGLDIETRNLPPNNVVFLLDVSGSMNAPNKLPLLKSAMRLLVNQLRPEDRVAIVVYAGAAGCVLEPTADKAQIFDAINRLKAGGSTAGGAGIRLAYQTAQDHFLQNGNNRVILATDGDFNVGVSSDGDLTRLIEEKRKSGVFLSVLGFGTGNLKDSKMEKLAGHGNGNYAYIDDILEAKKVLVNEMGGTLVTIAKDVKVQVEFNPRQVKAYRLIGYENRLLAKEDFDNDQKDAGELGAGHTVTALYELVPAGTDEPIRQAGKLKYQKTKLIDSDDLMTVKLRYKQPGGIASKLIVQTVKADDLNDLRAGANIGFASAVAEFGLLLRRSEHKGAANYGEVIRRARQTRGADVEGYRAEFIRLVEKAQMLDSEAVFLAE
ncbi:von Willebrand factor type A domain-containing protein [Pontiella sp.]|uniref:YfbK domain-containing protein n=1 Tax=Pontiella sp. TaxID=2837462 RepID=UPI00356B5517